ncbi:MAG: MFS transporter [Candidatus Cloacimonetes bacterium]|nr:MFS transporter [Candidatus Cloacimonadota bacterium]MCF7813718.1 MFS transporter [Candidatus Cloacimonadota bacterium]MCF7867784.1 MFS transporter [Candidatus Cloacimonadota bacterium]MCF7883238.1 MFS transporter [Candidatus Cloacimonadota bacterium]
MKMNRNIFGWIMYDFANSSFTTIIVTVIYSVFFKEVVVNQGELGTAMWGRAVSISMLLVAVSAPIFGAVADFSRAKKRFLFFNCYLTVIFTALLYFVRAGDIFTGMLFFIIANFGFNSGNVFYNALLPDVTNRENMGKVSGWGWAVGYIGGMISLLIVLPLVHNKWTPLVFPTVAAFFGIFAIPTFILLKEIRKPSKRTNYFKTAFKRIHRSLKSLRNFRELLKFIISYLIYNDGIIIVISFAAIYGSTRFDMSSKQLINYFIIANITSMIGAFTFGYVLDKIGAKKTITITLLIWIAVVIWAFLCKSINEFYLVGILAGIAIGSSQSSSRSMLALLTPKDKMAEFFGFYSVTGRIASILGPLVYGEISRITGDQRWAILSVLFFFIFGAIILQTVNEKKGQTAALSWQIEE